MNHLQTMKTTAALSAAVLTLALAPAALAAGGYRFTTIDYPGAAGLTSALDVNNHGDLAGTYTDAAGKYHGYLLLDGAFQAFDIPGSTQTVCMCIEDDRRVTGMYSDAQGFDHGFQWVHGRLVTIDYPGAAQTTGIQYVFGVGLGTWAIRSAGDFLLGWYADPAGGVHGFLEDHGAPREIAYPGGLIVPGQGTEAIALNHRGMVSGSYLLDTSPPLHGFVYDHGAYTTIDAPGAGGSYGTQPNGLNNQGTVVGLYTDANDAVHGFVHRDHVFTTVDVPGKPYTEIDSINDAGIITGEWIGVDGVQHGFVGTPR